MEMTASYGQFCPVAMAAEILCNRWTMVLLRELIAGSTRFNDLRRGLPRMSPALLSQRLKELTAAGIRVHLDDRDNHQMGFKYADWEMRGVPIRMELGPKDIEKDQCVLVRRDTRTKEFVPLAGTAARHGEIHVAMQHDLLEKARAFVAANTTRATADDDS